MSFALFPFLLFSNIVQMRWLQVSSPKEWTPILLTWYYWCCDSVDMTWQVANLLHPFRLHYFNPFLPSGCWLEEIINRRRRVVVHLPFGETVSYSWDNELQESHRSDGTSATWGTVSNSRDDELQVRSMALVMMDGVIHLHSLHEDWHNIYGCWSWMNLSNVDSWGDLLWSDEW